MLLCMRTTLNLDDELVREAKILAIRRHTTLTALIEQALREATCDPDGSEPQVIHLPVVDGGGFPDGFPFRSGAAMIEFLEGPSAPP